MEAAMAGYGLDINQVLDWTFPQLLLLSRRQKQRERGKHRFELMLAAGTLPLEAFDQLWQGLGGKPLDLNEVDSPSITTTPAVTGKIGQQAHGVDSKGNVVAPGAPLLSDIALGKAIAPELIPVSTTDKSKESDG